MTETETDALKIAEIVQRDNIKLTRNSKGYGWEIKILEQYMLPSHIARLKELNELMIKEFGIDKDLGRNKDDDYTGTSIN